MTTILGAFVLLTLLTMCVGALVMVYAVIKVLAMRPAVQPTVPPRKIRLETPHRLILVEQVNINLDKED